MFFRKSRTVARCTLIFILWFFLKHATALYGQWGMLSHTMPKNYLMILMLALVSSRCKAKSRNTLKSSNNWKAAPIDRKWKMGLISGNNICVRVMFILFTCHIITPSTSTTHIMSQGTPKSERMCQCYRTLIDTDTDEWDMLGCQYVYSMHSKWLFTSRIDQHH